ncbi:MAG: ATP-dependent Clp protease protease subunit, partial [Flavobacteriaceae bacterium]
MNYAQEFKNFAIKDQGINGNYYDTIMSSMYPVGMTPNIIEERQLNAIAMDVFSRLMMDRIIFLGTGINDQVANIVQAQ